MLFFPLFMGTISTPFQKIFPFFPSILWKSLTFEPMLWSASLIPFWNPQNVSYNIGHFKQLWTRILVFGSDRAQCFTTEKLWHFSINSHNSVIFQSRDPIFCMVVHLDHSYTLLYIPIHSFTIQYIPLHSNTFLYIPMPYFK